MLNSSRQLFGYTKDDLAVETLTLDNGILSCDIITFGAALRSLRIPDRSGSSVMLFWVMILWKSMRATRAILVLS